MVNCLSDIPLDFYWIIYSSWNLLVIFVLALGCLQTDVGASFSRSSILGTTWGWSFPVYDEILFGRQVSPGPHILSKEGLYQDILLACLPAGLHLTLGVGFVLKEVAIDCACLVMLVLILSSLPSKWWSFLTWFSSTVSGTLVMAWPPQLHTYFLLLMSCEVFLSGAGHYDRLLSGKNICE